MKLTVTRDEVINAIKENSTLDKAAASLGFSRRKLYNLQREMNITSEDIADDLPTIQEIIENISSNVVQNESNEDEEFAFVRENRKLKNQLKDMKVLYDKSLAALEESERLNNVFEEINDGIKELDVHVAFESNDVDDKSKSISVPTLFLSDLHYGEFVDSKQINGLNSYNVEIANIRLENVFRRALDYMDNHLANNYYPGMVVALGGDMVSGDIHEELKETNEITTMQSCLLLTQELIKGFNFLLENGVEKLFVPCVDGNHDRSNKKIQHKNRAKSSYSYMIYNMLKFAFKDNNRVKILISTSTDLLYRVFNHTYLLTHGDQFRGGDGIIGAIGPIVRGNTKKKSRNEILGLGYDTMILGHFHQLMNFKNQIIANGSLKGYDEYAYSCNFGYERPQQAFWITDPNIGVCTFTTIIADEKNEITSMNKQQVEDSWVSFKNM